MINRHIASFALVESGKNFFVRQSGFFSKIGVALIFFRQLKGGTAGEVL